MRLLPHMELILAVGLKLSTKSDIKLPKSYKRERQKDTDDYDQTKDTMRE